jgi:DNA mismatch endonuclease (patch repair protein)
MFPRRSWLTPACVLVFTLISAMDHVEPEKRSEIMRQVRTTGSRQEHMVRRMVWGLGYRYRLNYRDLPGSPDLAFPARRKVIFVHGCFWHGHDCSKGRLPKSNVAFWAQKVSRNQARDKAVIDSLIADGWKVLIIWQCALKNLPEVEQAIKAFLQ